MPVDASAEPVSCCAAPRFFHPEFLSGLAPGAVVLLAADTAQHAVRALRLRAGDSVVLFDGSGGEYAATLVHIEKREVQVRCDGFRAVEREAALPIRLVQCVQAGDRMDYTIQKVVELGVSEIVPVIARRSVVRLSGERAEKRVAHWRNIVVAASEQCGRNRLALVHDLCDLDKWLALAPKGVFASAARLILSPQAASSLGQLPQPAAIELLVGPEGGLSDDEELAAKSVAYRALRLGPRVMRTETAGLAALAALHARWGDFL